MPEADVIDGHAVVSGASGDQGRDADREAGVGQTPIECDQCRSLLGGDREVKRIAGPKHEADLIEKGAVAAGPAGRRSICPNSFDCRFSVRGVGQGEPFGLFLYDFDTLPGDYDDLVDLVILTPEGGAAASTIRAIDGRLREQMDRQAHARLPAERARRSRETAVLSTEACRTGCRLGQSVLTIAP